jgi:hypothetical protein
VSDYDSKEYADSLKKKHGITHLHPSSHLPVMMLQVRLFLFVPASPSSPLFLIY